MGRGRAPCCEKIGLKKGPWTPAEDMKLISFIHKHGHKNWRALPKQAGLLRCGKSCRLRWINYLRPDIKRGNFTPEEEETIIKLHESLGNKWSIIASKLPGRTDNEIKNVWNTHLKKRLVLKEANPPGTEPQESSITSSSPSSSFGSSLSYKFGQQTCPSEVHDMVLKQDNLIETFQIESNMNIWDMLHEPNELPCSSYSSSNSSSDSHSMHVDQIKGLRSVEEACSQFDSERPCEVHNTLQGMHQEEPLEEVLEIPFDPNLDFWNMLDSSLYPDENQLSTSEKQDEKEVESRGWLVYLESELGLQATSDNNKRTLTNDLVQPLISDFSDDILSEEEIDPVATYFQMGLSSPHNFCL